jgi:hypothetical protein
MKLMIVVSALTLAVSLSTGLASAHDVLGRVKAVELTQKVMTLEDGTRLYWTDALPIVGKIRSGDLVRVRYQERGGRLVLTEVEIVV